MEDISGGCGDEIAKNGYYKLGESRRLSGRQCAVGWEFKKPRLAL